MRKDRRPFSPFRRALRRTVTLTSAGALAVACAVGASARLEAAPFFAYVTADGSSPGVEGRSRLYEIDVRTDAVNGAAISLGSWEDAPTGYLAVSPGGRYVYLGMGRYVLGTPPGYNEPRIAVVDMKTRQLVHSFPVSGGMGTGTGGMALTPDGGTLYANRGYDSTVATHAIAVLSLPRGQVRALVPLPRGSSSNAIAVSPNGSSVVATTSTGLAFIDRETNTVSANQEFAGSISAITFSPDSATIYVLTNQGSDGKVLRVDAGKRVITDSISLGTYARALAVSPDGRRLYVTAGVSPGSMFVVNTDLWQIVTQVVPVGDYPDAVAVTPDGDKVYVTLSGSGPVVVLSAENYRVTKTIDGFGWVTNRGTNFVGPASAAISASVEYFHQGFGHYFTTNDSLEIDALDAEDFTGWARTGERFNVFLAPPAGTVSVCRFFADGFSGGSSHFFAPRGFGCEGAIGNTDWRYEGDVFYVRLPDATGTCPAGTIPVYRMYNNGQGGAPNHRLSTKLATRESMLARGWISEGAGVGVGMCAPEH